MNTFKQFLIEQATLPTKESIIEFINECARGEKNTWYNPKDQHQLLTAVLNNREHYNKLFGHDIIYSGPAYRVLSVNKMLSGGRKALTDIRQITTVLQEYEHLADDPIQSWTKDKKIAFQGLKHRIWTYNNIVAEDTFATVTLEGKIAGFDVNQISSESLYADEHEVLAPLNVPINIIGFTIRVPHNYPWRGKQSKFFSVGQFKEFAELYNNIIQYDKSPSEEDFKAKRERKKRS